MSGSGSVEAACCPEPGRRRCRLHPFALHPFARPSRPAECPPALPRGRPGTEGPSSLSAPAVLVVAVAVVVVVVSAVAWAMANYIHVPPGSPEVPKLNVTVADQEEQRCREGALSLLQHLRPHWDPQEVTLQVTPTPRPDAPRASRPRPRRPPAAQVPGIPPLPP